MRAKRKVATGIVTALLALTGALGLSVLNAPPASACVHQHCPQADPQPAAYEHNPFADPQPACWQFCPW